MKFILLFCVVINIPGHLRDSHTAAGNVWPNRAACQDTTIGLDMQSRNETGDRVYVEQFDCIQIEGPVDKFPVLEQIATGWERA